MDLNALRRDYTYTSPNGDGLADNPFHMFSTWFEEAVARNIDLPDAVVLATATKEGVPSARVVALRGFDPKGFTFYTNYHSRKGRELAENPYAALVFYWRELDRQIRIEGKVAKVGEEESDEYFATRSFESNVAAITSNQSEAIPNPQALRAAYVLLKKQLTGTMPDRPARWGGYRVVPTSFEFWQGKPDRLHERVRFDRQGDDNWARYYLAP